MAFDNNAITFGEVGLQGENLTNPTALEFSKTGNPTLFVTQQNGEIWRYEVASEADGPDGDSLPQFKVTNATKINDIKQQTQNYNDSGTINNTTERQVTGLATTTDEDGNDVLYVSSSDWRIAVGVDSGLDTNSGQIHKLVLDKDTGEVLSNIAIIRGFPRSEENHSTNGLQVHVDPETGHRILWIAQGGNTNSGAPGNNFAGTVDFVLSGTILKVDLDVLEAYDVRTDGNGEDFILDLPTLDDPTRANVDLTTLNIQDLEDAPNFSLDDNGNSPDWAGGNNGLNQAKLAAKALVSDDGQLTIVDNPLIVHAPGYRNNYDVIVTENDEVFTWDNGPNGGWGGQPLAWQDNKIVSDWTTQLATNKFNEAGSAGFGDQLHYAGDATDPYGPYGGAPNPLRAAKEVFDAAFNTDGSYKPANSTDPVLDEDGTTQIFANETEARDYLAKLLIIYTEQNNGTWVDSGAGVPADLFDIVSGYTWQQPGSSISNPQHHFTGTSVMDGTYFSPESELIPNGPDGSLKTYDTSTNGLAEYTATFFGGELQGAILAAAFNGTIYFEMPKDTNGDGRTDAVDSVGTISGFGSQPLGLTTLGDDGFSGVFFDVNNDGVDDFGGLVVAVTYGADNVTFFVPGGTPSDPSTDLDLDGVDNVNDSHVGDNMDGKGVIVGADQTAFWGFELNNPATTPPGAVASGNSIAGDIGLNAVWRNGVDKQVGEAADNPLYDDSVWNLGGASSFVSIDAADGGSAEGTANDQGDVLGIGFAAPSGIGGVTITTEMVNIFDYQLNKDTPAKTWDGGEKAGLMVGPGHQTTFAQGTIATIDDNGTIKYGLQLLVEENDIPNAIFVEMPGLETADNGNGDGNVQLALVLDLTPGAETVRAQATFMDGGVYGPVYETGVLDLPDDVVSAVKGQYVNASRQTGAVVGLVSTKPGDADDGFAASWDWVQIDGVGRDATDGEVLYRWNAGDADVAATDGGPDWLSDTAFMVGGPAYVDTHNITNLDASVPGTTPVGVFAQERWDPSSGAEMGLEFGDGGLAAGTYAARVYMGNGYSGTGAPGERVFTVSVEGQPFLPNLDLSATLGHQVGGMFEWVGEVTDGTLDIDFQRITENPLVNAVEIIKVSTAPTISAVDASVNESGGTVTVTIQSNVAIPSNETVTVSYEIRPGSAAAQQDYAAPALTFDSATGVYSGSGEIAGNSADLTVPIEIIGDADVEGDQTFELVITGVTGADATLGDASATVTIVDDDEDGGAGLPPDSVNGVPASGGDFSESGTSPTLVALATGTTRIVSTQEGDPDRDFDYIHFTVAEGTELTTINLAGFDDYDPSQLNATFLGIQAGSTFTETPAAPDIGNLLGGVVFSELDTGADLLADMADGVVEAYGNTLGFPTPLAAGDYTLWFSQNQGATTSTLDFVVQRVANGAATLAINETSDNVQISNYGDNSFQITNVGEKNIVSVEIDVTNALYTDSVFDPFGHAGDLAVKDLEINTGGGTGVRTPNNDENDPTNETYIGNGGIDGYKGIKLFFDNAVNGGFETGEALGFSVDMDPNSIAGADADTLNSGAVPDWDVGGISGAELIGSTFTVTFADGSTATGQLQGVGNQGGSKGLASQDSPDLAVDLTVNGLGSGGVVTYGSDGPSVIVNGPAGQTARVVLTKGIIQPVNNDFTGSYGAQLDAQLDALRGEDFPANNAAEFQTVDILLTGADQDITGLFDFTEVSVGLPLAVDEAQVPLGFVASVIDTTNGNLPLGGVTAPIYLTFDDTGNTPPEIANVSPVDVLEGQNTVIAVLATDADGNETVQLTVDLTDGDGAVVDPANYTFTDNGDGTGSLVFLAPHVDANAVFTATVAANDGVNPAVTKDILINVLDVAPASGEILYRVNVGGPDVSATDAGLNWGQDTGNAGNPNNSPYLVANGGGGYTYTATSSGAHPGPVDVGDPSIPVSTPAVIFDTERFDSDDDSEMRWAFAVDPGTEVEVRLFFAELYSGVDAAGERVFDVAVEGLVPASFDDIDTFAIAGPKGAVVHSHTVTVIDGTLDLEFIHGVENPALKGIEILSIAQQPSLGSIGDRVWNDADGDGVQDAGESGAAGVTVTLTGGGADGVIGTGGDDTTDTTTTDANGAYLFDSLNSDEEYQVMFVAPDGLEFTAADAGSDDALDSDADPNTGMTQTVTLAPGKFNDTLDAGLVQPAGKTITGTASADTITPAGNSPGVTGGTSAGGDDTITAHGGNDTVDGGGGADKIDGGNGNDVLSGGAGNDTLKGGYGYDTLDGGGGNDTADISHTTAGPAITLGEGGGNGSVVFADGTETLISIENVIGSLGDDEITGNSDANDLKGNDGNDLIDGLGGDDTVDGGAGADTFVLREGDGTDDIVNFEDMKDKLLLDGGLTFGDLTFDEENGDALIKVTSSDEVLARVIGRAGIIGSDDFDGDVGKNITGTASADTITPAGNSSGVTGGKPAGGDDTISALGGNDTVDGGGGADIIDGGLGEDSLMGGDGDDVLKGGYGFDTLDGGGGNDTADISHTTADPAITLGEGGGNGTVVFAGGIETLISIENVIGSLGDNDITGNSGANHLNGNDGDDTIDGGGGMDTLDGGAGVDRFVLRAGDGADRIVNFENGTDGFLLDGLVFADLDFIDAGPDTEIQIAATNEVLAVVEDVEPGIFDVTDFDPI